MFFEHRSMTRQDGRFVIPECVTARCGTTLQRLILREFWKNWTFCRSALSFAAQDGLCFEIGQAKRPALDGRAYAIAVEPSGISMVAENERAWIDGFMTLIDLMEIDQSGIVSIPSCMLRERAAVETRMIHFCLLPDTALWELEKFIRYCGALKYTHIILEFWGMLRYDCLAALSWKHGFRKEELRPLIALANDLGMEVIPMFNHWGHASQSRAMHGKHTVLDQAPHLAELFSADGWRWEIGSDRVRSLLRQIRGELIELCGKGSYFHIGCDEASGFGYTQGEMETVTDYINELSRDLAAQGRRTIMWADMLLYREKSADKTECYTTSAPNADCMAYLLDRLDRSILLADWQYDQKQYPIETALQLQGRDRQVLVCPWDRSFENLEACANTVKHHRLNGILHTTWHTLSGGTMHVGQTARLCFGSERCDTWFDAANKMATVIRKAAPTNGDYERAGWAKCEIGVCV